ncbi:hypothetical protein EEB14_22720 [Rhodococcus sp. WS4]|nr:hypothetical protein EEB14_22720 [Rhodococcus sp. WS4]
MSKPGGEERRITVADDEGTATFGATVDEVRITEDIPVSVYETTTDAKVGMAVRQEGTREWLALTLTLTTIAFGVAYVWAPMFVDEFDWERARDSFQVVFTTMVGLAGTAIGYYFSERRHQQEAAEEEGA